MGTFIKKIEADDLKIPSNCKDFRNWMIESCGQGDYVLLIRNKSQIHFLSESSTEMMSVFYVHGAGVMARIRQIYFTKKMVPYFYNELQVIRNLNLCILIYVIVIEFCHFEVGETYYFKNLMRTSSWLDKDIYRFAKNSTVSLIRNAKGLCFITEEFKKIEEIDNLESNDRFGK